MKHIIALLAEQTRYLDGRMAELDPGNSVETNEYLHLMSAKVNLQQVIDHLSNSMINWEAL